MAQSKKRPFVRLYRYYEILEVGRNATQDEIRRAYLKLAKMYHPDVNPDATALEKFKKINEAYEVLSDPTRRSSYDSSLAECPVCWTHEVMQTIDTYWRCRHCGCKFDPSRVSEIIEQVEKAAIPERLRNVLRIFQTTQCSWCKKFYTQPFLCPYARLQSSCVSFDRLGTEERTRFSGDEKWWWRMADMIQHVLEKGIMAKCRECGALNPNPQRVVCWQCGRNTLCCPRCREAPLLRYDIDKDFWKCPNAGCGKKFTIRSKKRVVEPTLSQELCPNCGKNLHYDAEVLLWRCRNCGRIYTYQDLRETIEEMSKEEFAEAAKTRRESTSAEQKNEAVSSGKAWFGNEYYDRKSKRWKRSGRGRMSWTVLPIFALFIASVVILYYVFSNFEQFDRAVAIAIVSAAAVMTIWLVATLRRLWRFRPRGVGLGRILLSLILLALIACSAAAFTGVAPFSELKEQVVEYFTNLSEETRTEDAGGSSSAMTSARSGIDIFDGKQPPYSKTFGTPIRLTNNNSATVPTWQQLKTFLLMDITDEKDYSLFSFPCGAFAEEVHNNAEDAGIRAAWVSVDFEDDSEGHALNAFNTIDKGLVYVDCTGDDPRFAISGRLVYNPTTGEMEWEYPPEPDYDKVAYVMVGREYGLISVEVAASPEYSFYESYLAKREEYEMALETYNQEVESYSQALGGRTILQEPEYSRFMEWLGRLNAKLAELEVLSKELGDFYWQSLGVVASIEIYW